MNVETIAGLITSVGFPIAACCVMFWQNSSLQKTLQDMQLTLQKLADRIDCHTAIHAEKGE